MSDQIAYSLKEASAKVSQSVDTLRRAINTTDPQAWPPPLKAKRAGRNQTGHLMVLHTELMRWANSWPDA